MAKQLVEEATSSGQGLITLATRNPHTIVKIHTVPHTALSGLTATGRNPPYKCGM